MRGQLRLDRGKLVVERHHRILQRLDLARAIDRIIHRPRHVQHQHDIRVHEVERGIAAHRHRQRFEAEQAHDRGRDRGRGVHPDHARFRLGDHRGEGLRPVLPLRKVERKELLPRIAHRIVEGIVLHHPPRGQRGGVAGALHLALRHIGAAEVHPATDHDGQRDQARSDYRQHVAFVVVQQPGQ